MTWIPAFAGMTGGGGSGGVISATTGHPGGGRGPVRRAGRWEY